jgi:cysteinyl-tRNA synthetase
MTLRLHNTLTRMKEDFVPLKPENVRMYVCGPTVYDFAHIGNARPVIVFDVLFRLLRHLYGEAHVTYVRNITDIDDKINARALAESHSIREITERTAKQYHEDVAALGCLPPTHEPRATDHIGQMIAMIAQLIEAGHAYEADGHVLFDVSSKPDYGKLARRSLDEMIAGARVDVAPYKRGAMDFVLWKPSDANTPGWDSPWGRGRPGWHIECSAMAGELLGETFDIHGGGIDLVFPHHENEIAQSEGAHHNHPLARYWMHNGFLNVEGEKMSKSLGNFVTIRELRQRWRGLDMRLAMLMTNYRQPINWTEARLLEARMTLQKFALHVTGNAPETDQVYQPILDALLDDMNSHLAIVHLHELADSFSGQTVSDATLARRFDSFANSLKLLGLYDGILEYVQNANPDQSIRSDLEIAWTKNVEKLVATRTSAKRNRDFKDADRIRDELIRMGVSLSDNPDGTTTWEVKR